MGLFDGGISGVVARLSGILGAHGDVVPISIKLDVLRAQSQLERERSVYLQLPQIMPFGDGDQDVLFAARFKGAIMALSWIARSAKQKRKDLLPDT